jgi:tetratricopeptide (TPR) repeat protein
MTDKRIFKRYTKDSDFHLEYNGKTLKAKMIDYSLDGLGLSLKSGLSLKKGEKVYVSANAPQINTSGEVMWIHQGSSGQKVGIKKSGTLMGCMEDFHFADTLLGLQMGQRTGILQVELGEIVRKIYVSSGDMIFSTSNYEREHLGAMLLREGRITPEQYRGVLQEMKETNQRMGRVLVGQGLMTPKEIWKIVRKQIEEIILNLFNLEEGIFTFNEMLAFLTEELITLKLSAANIIYYGIKRINNLRRVGRNMPSPDKVLYYSSDPLNLFQNLRLDQAGQKVISCLNRKSTIRDIFGLTGLDDIEGLKTMYALLNTRIIEVIDGKEASLDLSKDEIEEIFEKKADPRTMEMIENMFRNHERLGFYRALGLNSDASPSEIKKAYFQAAKKYHPDIHFFLENDSLKYKLSHIFSYIHNAYSTLSDPERKRKYDKSLTIKPAKIASKQDKARERFEYGRALYRKKQFEEAELIIRQALYIDSFKSEYHYYYGLALLEQAKYSDAKKALEEAIRLDPINPDYITALGNLFLKIGSPTRAKTMFKKALKISQDNETAFEGLEKIKQKT